MANPEGEKSQRKRLSELCSECFMLILQLRATAEFGDPLVLRKRIHDLFDKLERGARKEGYNLEEIQSAKFSLAAFLDESILASQWSQKDYWVGRTLGMELFDRMDAGEEFFNNLEKLRRHSAENLELLEVYYLCMSLGFKGKYLIFEQEKLRLIIEDVYNEIRSRRHIGSVALSPHGGRSEQIADVVKKEVPAWIIAVGAGLIGFIFWVIMLLLSQSELSDVMRQIG